jgi:hypothetical protein
MVNKAKVRKSVKKLLECTLRDYKQQASVPATDTFEEGEKRRCLIGAAVHNTRIYERVNEGGLDWEQAAQKYFGVLPSECEAIIQGFDENVEKEDENGWFKTVENPSSQALASTFGKGNRVAFLANRLRRELLPS